MLKSVSPKRAAPALAALLAFSPIAFGASAPVPPALLISAGAMPAASASGSQPTPDAQTVQFNTTAALALPIGGTASLTLPRLGTLAVVHDRNEAHPNGDTTWIGYFRDYGTDYRVLITTPGAKEGTKGGAKGVVGRISSPDGEFSLLPGNGGVWLLDRKMAGAATALVDQGDAVVPPATSGDNTASASVWTFFPPPQSTVDLMLVYTPRMAQIYGDALQTRLNNLVAISNQSLIDSGVNITLRLVHAEQVDYLADPAMTDSMVPVLNALTGGQDVFAGIPALRNQHGADLVQLIVSPTAQFCGGGIGWVATPPSSAYGYSVIYDHANVLGCQGNDLVSAHEIGHNLGANHDRAHTAMTPGTDYSYGYGIPGKFADIMSLNYINAPPVAKFSSPNLLCGPDSAPCGIAPGQPNAADAAQKLNDNRVAVASYLPAADAPPPAVACLFDWAERVYPGLFPIAARVPGVWTLYFYRYYPAANAYLGTSLFGGDVYYMGPDGVMKDVGALSDWTRASGCQ